MLDEAVSVDAIEERRMTAVRAAQILDTDPETVYEDAVLLASTICGTPISLVSVVDEKRQWFKARMGLELNGTPREYAFCAHAIKQHDLFVIADAQQDVRFQDNPLVTGEHNIRFYAGFPLRTLGDEAVGTLCVFDTRPRELTEEQKAALSVLGRQVSAQIALRTQMNLLNQALEERHSIEQKISSSNALFEAFMDNSPLLGYVKAEDGRLIYYNRPFAERFQITQEEWINKTDFDLWPIEFASRYRLDDLSVLKDGKPLVTEHTSPGPQDAVIHWRSYKFRFVNDDGRSFLAGVSLDISAAKEAEEHLKRSHDELHLANEQLRELSLTDSLTGLCNRRGFDEHLRQEFTIAERYGLDFSILLFDVDHFKSLNDTFGHTAGDGVLRQIGDLLRASGRHSDLVCRYGGEEFAILLPATSIKQAVLRANRVRRTIEGTAWKLRPMTISAGVSTNVPGIADAGEMVRMADLALYEAKEQGRNRVASYSPSLNAPATQAI